MTNCIFCKILNGEIPSKIIYQDEYCFAINDINPKAKKHILVIPKEHIESLNEVYDMELMMHMFEAIKKINAQEGINHFQTHINTGKSAGQEVMHLHIHILAN
ncbi:MAG: histidine triad nucleotide-binding protein [Candidatus Gastranaerophilales bacterium]|nr:histidine triad nucleotide-binding protein [Candidatus Gastranaerophilales bacterium]